MKSFEIKKAPHNDGTLELDSEAVELLAQLDKEMEMSRQLRELSSVALSALEEADREVDTSPVENRSDAVQDAPISGEQWTEADGK